MISFIFKCFLVLTVGPVLFSVLLIFSSVRKMVTNRAIRPGTISTGIKNPINEPRARKLVGRYVLVRYGVGLLFKVTVNPLSETLCWLLIEVYQLLLRGPSVMSNFSSWSSYSSTVVENFWKVLYFAEVVTKIS